MIENSPTLPPSKTEGLTPRQILEHAQSRGRERHMERVMRLHERLSQARETVKRGWQAVRETGKKVGGALLTAEAIVFDPQIHREIRGYVRERIQESGERLGRKLKEIREDFDDRRERLTNAALDRIRMIRRGVNERVITPVVEGAKKVGNAVATGAENGVLFVVQTAEGAYETGKAVVEAGRRTIEQGKEKAREWGDRLTQFFTRQGERVKEGIQTGINKTIALGIEIGTLPQRAELALTERRLAKLERRQQMITMHRENLRRKVQQKREVAQALRNSAHGLRGRS